MALSRTILYGAGSTGKTVSTVTCLKHPKIKRLIYLQTERNSAPGVAEGLKIHKITPQAGQIITSFPAQKENVFGNLSRALKGYQEESKTDALKGGVKTNQNKDKYGYLTSIINNLENFSGEDYVTGEKVTLGNIGNLKGEEDVLIIDGLSVLSEETWKSLIGDKVLISQDDYKPLQKYFSDILEALSKCTNAHLILLAHQIEKFETKFDGGKQYQELVRIEVDFNMGSKPYERWIGKFTDVIHTEKLGIKYIWETQKLKVHGVARNLPYGPNLEPDFSKYSFFN